MNVRSLSAQHRDILASLSLLPAAQSLIINEKGADLSYPKAKVTRSNRVGCASSLRVRSGHMGYVSFRGHR
jgi:hypothetical protein